MSTDTDTAVEWGTIYTLGYAQPDAAARLDRLMREPKTCLVDIRYQPRSQWAHQWNRAALTARYGRRYIWERRLGNVHYREQELGIALAAGHQNAIGEAAALICEGTSLILLCACKDARACHRSLVAKLIQDELPVPKHREVRPMMHPYAIDVSPLVLDLLAKDASVAIGVSGGKDSTAAAFATTAYLDTLGHRGPRLLIHSDLGRVEWRDSLPMCERLADRLGLELVVVHRQAGDLMDRWLVRWHKTSNATRVLPASSSFSLGRRRVCAFAPRN